MSRYKGRLSLADIIRFEKANNPPPEEQEELNKIIKAETEKIRSKWSAYVRHSRSNGMDSCMDTKNKRFLVDRVNFTNNPIQTIDL